MTVTTDKGKTFPIEWMWPQRQVTDRLMIGLRDERPLTEIAGDFGGCGRFRRQSEEEGDMICDGYTELICLSRSDYGLDNGYVLVILSRPAKE